MSKGTVLFTMQQQNNQENNIQEQEELSVSSPQTNETDNLSAILEKLSAPFSPDEISFRVQSVKPGKNNKLPTAILVAYIDSRDVMNRLDEVFPLAWEDAYQKVELSTPTGFVQGWECTITVTLPDGRKISRKDVGEITDIEALKGGYSDALKRCAVKFGIARHLYELPPIMATVHPQRETTIAPWNQWEYCSSKNIKGYYVRPNLASIEAKNNRLAQQNQQRENHRQEVMANYSSTNNGSQKQPNNGGKLQGNPQGTKQSQNRQPEPQNGPTQKEYNQCVNHVSSLMRELNIPVENVALICRNVLKVQLMEDLPLNQIPYEILQQVYALLNPVKLLLMNAKAFGLDNNGVYNFASQYLNKTVMKVSDLFGINEKDVKNVLEQVKQYFASNQRQQA